MSKQLKTKPDDLVTSPLGDQASPATLGRPKPMSLGEARRNFAIPRYLLSDGKITPLEVMVEVMRLHYAAQDFEKAVAVAEKAAPYMHPKLAAIQTSVAFNADEADIHAPSLVIKFTNGVQPPPVIDQADGEN
ncbi:MAG: hypothetical protein PHU06_06040 [Gallionella sp.]|nr:hypothetical protein [Gallionella sp.]MDD4958400.1 hypothetical protein [Gallionella sp.]